MTSENSASHNVPADPVREGGGGNGKPTPDAGRDILSGAGDVVFGAALSLAGEPAPASILDPGQGAEVLTVADLLIDSAADIDNAGAFLKFDTTSSPGNTIVSVGLDGGCAVVPLVMVHGEMTLAQLLSGGQIDYTP